MIDGMAVSVIDPVADYAELMESLFDFAAIRTLLSSGFHIKFVRIAFIFRKEDPYIKYYWEEEEISDDSDSAG